MSLFEVKHPLPSDKSECSKQQTWTPEKGGDQASADSKQFLVSMLAMHTYRPEQKWVLSCIKLINPLLERGYSLSP